MKYAGLCGQYIYPPNAYLYANCTILAYHFYNTICRLRQSEEIFLYDKLIDFPEADEKLVTEFLSIEYDSEKLNYPFEAPGFNKAAALWAARTTYTFCQLIFYRQHEAAMLPGLLPAYSGKIDAAAILSADLCLRFIPQALASVKATDPEDAIIDIMEQHLMQWHYAAIGYALTIEQIDCTAILQNHCLQQLYIDRLIEKKDKQKAMMPQLLPLVKATLGIHESIFWKELNSELIT